MENLTENHTKNRIVYLDNDEIAEPRKVINLFFDACSLPEHLDTLREWRDDVAFGTDYTRKRSPDNLLYDYELTVRLVEAAWLLRGQKMGKLSIGKENNKVAKWYIRTEKKKFAHYPRALDLRETLKPSLVLKNIFKPYSVTEYRKILNKWLYDALSMNFLEESHSKYEVITVYEQLVKLFEAMWLINQRFKYR